MMTRPDVLVLIAALSIAGCSLTAADHERLGDRAYAERDFTGALFEYQLALRQGTPSPTLRWKAGLAALNARDLPEAAGQFRALAELSPERGQLAADGLERVARAASGEGHRAALAAALQALQAVAPERALGAFARELATDMGGEMGPADAGNVLLQAAAGAPDARILDSLMFGYAMTRLNLGRCNQAVPVFEALLRRRREPSVLSEARIRATACALALGRRARNRGAPDDAERWFVRAVGVGDGNRPSRIAYLELGRIRFARGDMAGARDAYLRAMEGAPGDSIAIEAQRGLDRLPAFIP